MLPLATSGTLLNDASPFLDVEADVASADG
jgi:hypothetical protein